MSLKNPVTPPGIDPKTARLVAQRLNHYATPASPTFRVHYLSHLINCTPTKSYLHISTSLATAVTHPDPYRLLTFQMPNHMFHQLHSVCTKVQPNYEAIVKFRKSVIIRGKKLLAHSPTPKLKDHPLSATRYKLFNIFAATLHTVGRSSIRNQTTRHAVVTGTNYHGVTNTV